MSSVLGLVRGLVGLGALAWLLSSAHPRARAVPATPAPDSPDALLPPDRAALPPAAEEKPAGPGLRALQVLLGAVGLVVLAWGAWLVFDLGTDSWLSVGLWLAGGVLGHDALLAPVVVLLGVLATSLVPPAVRAPLAVALIVWGSITLVAVPVLGRFGALSDNPTLLDRPYQLSWLIGTGLVATAVAVASLLRSRQTDHDGYRTATRQP